MNGGTLTADIKTTSVLRRVPALDSSSYQAVPGIEGDVCLFELAPDAPAVKVEAVSGRPMTLVSGDLFLGTAGYRESTRWAVGGIPPGGLVPNSRYCLLADCGVVGDLLGDSPREQRHALRVNYLGAVQREKSTLNIMQFAAGRDAGEKDQNAPVFLVVGTSAEVGKTTAGVAVLQSLRQKGHACVIAWKATGTSSVTELSTYVDFGAARVLDCVDFGLPTTYPSGRHDIKAIFEQALDYCLSLEADAVLIECGGDIFGANVPVLVECLKHRRSEFQVILVAADALAALGGKQILEQMALPPALITGPCSDTLTLQERTQALCGIPTLNMARR